MTAKEAKAKLAEARELLNRSDELLAKWTLNYHNERFDELTYFSNKLTDDIEGFLDKKGWIEITTTIELPLPATDGKTIAEVRKVTVPAWKCSDTGQVFTDHRSDKILDDIRKQYKKVKDE